MFTWGRNLQKKVNTPLTCHIQEKSDDQRKYAKLANYMPTLLLLNKYMT